MWVGLGGKESRRVSQLVQMDEQGFQPPRGPNPQVESLYLELSLALNCVQQKVNFDMPPPHSKCCRYRCVHFRRPWLKVPSRWACRVTWPTRLLLRPCW